MSTLLHGRSFSSILTPPSLSIERPQRIRVLLRYTKTQQRTADTAVDAESIDGPSPQNELLLYSDAREAPRGQTVENRVAHPAALDTWPRPMMCEVVGESKQCRDAAAVACDWALRIKRTRLYSAEWVHFAIQVPLDLASRHDYDQ